MINIYENKYLLLGIMGALVVFYGTTQNLPQPYFIVGASALLTTAIHYRLLYFVALEIILIAGHIAIVLGSGPYTQFALPILLCVQLLFFYIMLGKENKYFLFLGICGIALLSVGLAFNNQKMFFVGSSFIAVYSYYHGFKGCSPIYIWALLNTAFTFTSLYKIFFS